jgi:predicted RNA-binding Zn ribbon-like protein
LLVMSKQQEAPGELEHVRDFVNTIDVEQDAERLTSPARLAAWLVDRGLASPGLAASELDLENALTLREALRAILLAHNGDDSAPAQAAAALDEAARRSSLRLRFDARGAGTLEPEARGVDGALGRLVAIVHRAAGDGTWERLKACRDHSCEWAFYDHTKNRSGAWCNMEVCGNRAKARAYRERREADPGVQG